ncbi:MAG: hypothetical protein NC417_13995 [Candidatus Gastranaerophilales bacterium]|nr:hypothetical protein [Candidatus Gastranaerophilales bacterium]
MMCHWLLYAVILGSAYTCCEKWEQIVWVTVMVTGFFVAYYYCVGAIEFTSTAGLLAMAGYACLLLHDNRKKGLIIFFLLELLSYQLRSQAMLMVQPLGFAAAVVTEAGRDLPWRQKGKEIFCVAGGVLLVVSISAAGHLIGYHGAEWERYQQYNDTITAMFDYYGKPSYEEVSDILEDYGISKEKYEAYCLYMVLDWEKDIECDRQLEVRAIGREERELKIGALLREVYQVSVGESQWGIGGVTVIAWILFLLETLIRKRWASLCGGVVFLGGARTAVWSFLVWGGRLPVRVTFPLMACETMFLLVLVWNDCVGWKNALWKKGLLILGSLIFCIAGISSGKLQSRFVREMNEGQAIFMEGLKEMQEYFQNRPQDRFLVDANSLSSYKGNVFETSIYHPINAVVSGGWFSNSPGAQQRLKDYLGDTDGFYFVIYADGNQENTPQFAYLVQEMGAGPKLVEMWTASHGGVYGFYYFEGAFPFQYL